MIRAFIRFAIDRPILNHILLAFMVVLSVFAYQNIPKEIFPPSTLDEISVTGGYPGASADVLDKMAVKQLEDGLKGLSDIDTLESVIQNGSFRITADIKPGSDKQLVLSDVKDIIANIRRDLPADMDEPIAKVVVHDYPLLLVAISGDVPKKRLLEAADDLKSRLALIKDLSGLAIRGDADDEVRIVFDQKKLDAYGVSKQGFYRAVSSLASIFPAGTIKATGSHLYISTINGEKNATAIMRTLLTVDGKRLRLGDVAHVTVGLGDPSQISHFNGKPNVSLNVNKTKEGNAIALSRQIKRILQTYRKTYPDLTFEVYTDTSVWVKNRLNLVTSNIIFGLILVFAALFLSVNARIAWVVAIGIPTSFMVALIAADAIGYSLNMLTMLGALIALGMLVDEAIVVAENIYRHVEMGKPIREAAIEGAAEMFPAVLTATLTTVFAFLPLLIMSGKLGMFMQVLPVMISVLLLSSLFEAFYFLPLHAKEFFSFKRPSVDHIKAGSVWQRAMARYRAFLLRLLRRKKTATAVLVVAILAGTYGMLKTTKFQLFPEFDAQQIYLNGKVDVNYDLYDTEALVTQIEKELLALLDPQDVDSITAIVGFKFNPDATFETGENLFQIFINLHEKAPENFFDRYINPLFSLEYDDSDMIRRIKAQEIAKKVQERIVKKYRGVRIEGKPLYEEMNVYVQQTGIVSHDIEVGFASEDEAKILEALRRIEAVLREIDGVHDVSDNAVEGERELKLRINDYGQRLGFTEAYVVEVLRGAFLRAEYGKMFDKTGLIRIRLEEASRESKANLKRFRIAVPGTQRYVRLGDVCDFFYKKGFVKIFKENGKKLRSVYASVDKHVVTPSEVMDRLSPLLEELRKEGLEVIVKGEERENRQIKREMMQAALMAMFLIFITLVWMFNSFVLPLIVLSTIPLSVLGALIGTKLMGLHLTLPGVMGLIGLAGVVVNDGLIMLDFIKGSRTYDALAQRASLRLRPIVLTSVTTVLGLSSLMFFASGQALILQPMAVSLGFGIAWATVLNLIYVPLLYAVVYRVGTYAKKA